MQADVILVWPAGHQQMLVTGSSTNLHELGFKSLADGRLPRPGQTSEEDAETLLCPGRVSLCRDAYFRVVLFNYG